MIKTMEPQAFELELRSRIKPFLVAFLRRNERFRAQAEALDGASRDHADVLPCYLFDADYLDTAMARYKVKGTPTFLLFSEGREVDRLIGETDRETLDDFIRKAIGEH